MGKPQTRWPSNKLIAKLHGPFKVSKVLLPTAIKLELLSRWRIHNTFHVLLIELSRLKSTRSPPERSSTGEQNKLGYDVVGYQFETE
jgi:hypothetical protein